MIPLGLICYDNKITWTSKGFLKHGASLYLKFEGLNLSVVIIFKTFHWLKNFESCSVVSMARH